VIGALRAVVASIDKTLPISNIRTLEEIVDASVATRRFTMLLLIVFAGVALLLALAGVYGSLPTPWPDAPPKSAYGSRSALRPVR
jgi:putative ABC transport system permease protein